MSGREWQLKEAVRNGKRMIVLTGHVETVWTHSPIDNVRVFSQKFNYELCVYEYVITPGTYGYFINSMILNNRLSNSFYIPNQRISNNYRDFTGFFMLLRIMPIKEIRIHIFRFIGACMIKESKWINMSKNDKNYANYGTHEAKIELMDTIYIEYFKMPELLGETD
jgi:hypothetical protein